MKWQRQCYLKLHGGSVHESSHYHRVEMGLTLRDKWSSVIMCLYHVHAALVLEKKSSGLCPCHRWHVGQEA